MKVSICALTLCLLLLCGCGVSASQGTVDVDLTALSSTVAAGEIFNITMGSPADYLGKSIKADGYYSAAMAQDGNDYHYIVIVDNTACCEYTLEFKLESGEYPTPRSGISVVGKYSNYDENGEPRYYLSVTEMEPNPKADAPASGFVLGGR